MRICGAQLKSLEQESHTHGNDDQLSRVGSIGRDKTIDDDDNAEPIHWHVSLHMYTVLKTMTPA